MASLLWDAAKGEEDSLGGPLFLLHQFLKLHAGLEQGKSRVCCRGRPQVLAGRLAELPGLAELNRFAQ